jgi:hypothetical protein
MNRLLSSGENMREALRFHTKVGALKFCAISIHAVSLVAVIGALWPQQQPLD